MNILIVGCRKVGARLAAILDREGHDISIVDQDERAFERLDEDFEGFKTCGIPIDQDVLREAGIENCDAVAAVSPDDNVNIMVSELAREVFHVDTVLARIYDPDREAVFSNFGLHTICPTNMTVAAVRSALLEKERPRTLNLAAQTVAFRTLPAPAHLIGEDVSRVDLEESQSIFAVEHGGHGMELYQGQQIELAAADQIVVASLVD